MRSLPHYRLKIMILIDQSSLPRSVKIWFFNQLIEKPIKKGLREEGIEGV